ncbi:hypothetical protein UFOVP1276_54 [uncultured Caudovirales phage]|uniref:Uncharacterized protein n=1 Tax=uncultured Caudovirales phage TaxID=2100421 RepID=A0A6J5PEF6_9CAUD|nr:hypothetical protein UFOVP875_85 [uncultured Caudovirales phage]CAB4195121.1 hypothetical protein UFOVP1276_54 [uncultured Caudovirales phage]CAB4205027.1 hypothetical protein UFOVP1403_12 [uncultured Caudovirales phage]CAB5238147.1 hypothetical protein UFOVP1507_83 [uncultured Caudovirales phage]
MPLQKVLLKPGVNRENTRYTNEGGWYESDNIRFRQGTPEKLGGWQQISPSTYAGVCRSLWNWTTLTGANLLGVGTSSKFYLENTGAYYDITPIYTTSTLGANPFATVNLTTTVTVTDSNYNPQVGDFVIFNGATTFNGVTISGEYEVQTAPTSTTYTITSATTATGTGSGGGSVAFASYLLHIGSAANAAFAGWGSNAWNTGNWGGLGYASTATLAIWSQWNFGQDLVFGPKLGRLYYWNATPAVNLAVPTTVTITNGTDAVCTLTTNTTTPIISGTAIMFQTTGALPLPLVPYTVYYVTKNALNNTFQLSFTYADYVAGTFIDTSTAGSGVHSLSARGIAVSDLAGASSVPIAQNTILVSDSSRFVFCFGANPYGSTTYDPMTVRWSNQESVVEWAPSVTNQAGEIQLSHGSKIESVLQSRQEVLVWTDAAIYSLQYLGPPYVWGNQLLSDNISIASMNSAAYASGVSYWMGKDKFYKYDGRVQTLRCDLLRYVYNDINITQFDQVFAGTNEGFTEIWWFYCSQSSTTVNRYVIYNYAEDIWYYGSMARTAWLDTALRNYPIAATYVNNLVYHEFGVDDGTTATAVPIEASITSAQYDIGDGHNFAFVYRMIPDLTFRGSTAGTTPAVTMYLQGLNNSGSGITQTGNAAVTYSGSAPSVINVDEFTGQIYIRIRGRQMQMKITSNTLGTQWQLGAPRIDLRQDGRR